VLRSLKFACLLVLLIVPACRDKLPAHTLTPVKSPPALVTPSPAASVPDPASSQTPTSPLAPLATLPLPVAAPSPTASSTSPSLPAVITVSNTASLMEAARVVFSPWDQVLALAWSPGGEILAASAGENLHLLELPGLAERMHIELGVNAPGLAFSPEGQFLASGDRNGSLRTWRVATGELLLEIQAHQKPMSSATYSPDGQILASAGYDAVARLWDSSSGEKLNEMIGGTFAIPAIAFTPDGASLAIVNGEVIRLRDVASTRFVRTIVGEAPFFSIAFSPDGQLLASGDVANTIRLWDMGGQTSPATEVRESRQTLLGHSGRTGRPEALVWQLAFSPDGNLLASAGGDATVRVWQVDSGRLLTTLSGHTAAVTSVGFSPDGRWLSSGGLDGTVILWSAAPWDS